jgi:hypothetical protein
MGEGGPVDRSHVSVTQSRRPSFTATHINELRRQMSDPSRCDFSAAIRLAAAGYEAETIRQAVRAASPNLEERKRRHVEDYLRRTVDAAIEAHTRRAERDRSRERDNDMER